MKNKFSVFLSTTVLIPLFVILTLNNISIAEFYTTTGKIVEINMETKTLTVIYERINKTVIINFDDDTIVEVGKEKKTIADIKVGHKVEVVWNFPGKRGVARSISREPTSEEQKVIDARKEARKRLEAEQTKIAEEKKRKAEEEKRKEINKRYNEFVEKNSIEAWPSIQELSANPFVYEGKIIAIQAHFETMQTATQGIFGVDNGAFFVVSDIPKGMFKKTGSIVVLAGRVIGKTELQVPLLGLMQVPHLKFVGVHLCQDNNCNDIIPDSSESNIKYQTDIKIPDEHDSSLEKSKPKFQLISYIKSKNKQTVLDLKIGVKQCIPESEYKVTVKSYIPDAELKQEPINKSDEPNNPAILVKLFSSGKSGAEGWLIAKDRNYYEDRKQNLLIKYIWLFTEQELDKVVNSIETEKPKISVTLSEKGLSQDYSIELNRVYKFEGSDYTVKMLQYVHNYGDRRPLSEQPPDNPAVQVEINGPEGAETRWVFEKFPDWDKMHPAKYKNLKITCSGIASAYMAKNTVRIYQTPEGKQVLVYIKDKHIAETVPGELEKKYTIPDTGNQVMVASYFPSFDFKKDVIKKSDEVGSPAILAEVEGPGGKVEDWIFSSNQYATWYTDNNFALVYERVKENNSDKSLQSERK